MIARQEHRSLLIPVIVGIMGAIWAIIAIFEGGRPKVVEPPVLEQTPVVALEEPLATPAPITPVQESVPAATSPTPALVTKVEATPERPKPAPTPPPPVAKIVSDFFSIRAIKLLKKEPADGVGVWKFEENEPKVPTEFLPCLDVTVTARENTRTEKTLAKAHFFDSGNHLVFTQASPSNAGKKSETSHFSLPVMFAKNQTAHIYFEIPDQLRDKQWKAVVVFGDRHEARAMAYPSTASAFLLDYPEKKLVEDRSIKNIVRKSAMDPLIEHVVRTRNPDMPQITLFLRPPAGISDASEVEGVLAVCILANGLEDLKRELRKEEMTGDYAGLLGFANKHKLAILAWGARRLWDPVSNYDDLSREKAREADQSFDTVANAWERGVKDLGDKYGIPQKNFLLWGCCGSAQWAQRLCLRKPEYFLAIHIHTPGSFDKPPPDATKVLWCLTMGELDGGYERSKRWVKTVREMGYPIVYKAIPGIGHATHPDTTALGFEFFKFALLQKDKRDALDEELAKTGNKVLPRPWPEEFRAPAFYGDMVNQEMLPPDKVARIPEGFRIALPTKGIADIWARDK